MESQSALTFVDYAKAFGPFLAAIVAVGVGAMQYYLQRQQLRQNLYDKRFRVFYAIQKVLRHKHMTAEAPSLLSDLSQETAEVSFLFGPEIKDLVSEIDSALRELGRQGHVQDDNPAVEDNKTFATALVHWVALTNTAERLFVPYLQLHHDQSCLSRLFARIDA